MLRETAVVEADDALLFKFLCSFLSSPDVNFGVLELQNICQPKYSMKLMNTSRFNEFHETTLSLLSKNF